MREFSIITSSNKITGHVVSAASPSIGGWLALIVHSYSARNLENTTYQFKIELFRNGFQQVIVHDYTASTEEEIFQKSVFFNCEIELSFEELISLQKQMKLIMQQVLTKKPHERDFPEWIAV